MEFTYIGNGVVNFHGCPEVEVDYFFKLKYVLGSKVYDSISAKKGILEAVIVRKAWYVHDPRTGKRKSLYKDNYNWIHNEADLCSQVEAIEFISNYYNNKLEDVEHALAELNC